MFQYLVGLIVFVFRFIFLSDAIAGAQHGPPSIILSSYGPCVCVTVMEWTFSCECWVPSSFSLSDSCRRDNSQRSHGVAGRLESSDRVSEREREKRKDQDRTSDRETLKLVCSSLMIMHRHVILIAHQYSWSALFPRRIYPLLRLPNFTTPLPFRS